MAVFGYARVSTDGQMIGFPNRESFIPGRKGGSPSNTRGGSRIPELGPYGCVVGLTKDNASGIRLHK